jgi:hypothetical protein
MVGRAGRLLALAATGAAAGGLLTACNNDESSPSNGGATAPFSQAYGVWTPSHWDTCSKEIHDQYSVVGPDGKRYPTWHPPVDPATGCSFGHEHGRDPRGSALYATTGKIPFGLANEALDTWDPNGQRHEDHVGHKIEWENGVQLEKTLGNTRVEIGVTCDFLTKIHQGTHSKDAFTNNLHELAYHVRCSDGTEIHVTLMVAFGNPGEFVRSCDKNTTISAGSPTPANSPAGNGVRFIPDRSCINQFILVPNGQFSQFSQGLYEDWVSGNYISTASGTRLAYFDPHFAVFSPSRYFDGSRADLTGRSMDLCYQTAPNGNHAHGGACDASTSNGQLAGVSWDDPRSQLNGLIREVYFNQTSITNAAGPTTWYTDPFGGHASTTRFPGSVKQFIARIDNTRPFPLESQTFGGNRNYGGQGVHAPN